MNTYTFHSDCNFNLQADLYLAKGPSRGKTVLYYHGGGLLAGTRKDFPSKYREMFLNAGYNFLAMDYLLAPESNLEHIISSGLWGISWFLSNWNSALSLDSNEYILFGRSAGAYLTLQLAAQIKKTGALNMPKALLLFYGYPSFLEPEFSLPNTHYASFPSISREAAFQTVKKEPVSDMPNRERLLLYLYARQTGTWTELLGSQKELNAYSLSEAQLSLLPPSFLTASSWDMDVPFGISKKMGKLIPGSYFYPVYYMEHDFDSDLKRPEGQTAYEECFKWLKLSL